MKVCPRIRYFLSTILLSAFIFFTLSLGYSWLYTYQMKSLAAEGATRLELYCTYLQGVLEKYESLPELLANDSMLIGLLNDPHNPDRIQNLNKYLETINNISGSSDTYLMDNQGLTLAASNWNEEYSFPGKNFSYRPYFQEAMGGHLGRFFALGTASSLRGYYFAYPVRQNNTILGVLVIKINIDSVEDHWGHADETFLVTDSDGVIFLTTKKNWHFRTWAPLSEEAKKSVVDSRRYPIASLEPLNVTGEEASDFGKIVQIKTHGDFKAKKFLLQTRHMEHAGWDVQILTDTWRVERFVFLNFVMVCFIFILGCLFVLVFKQRRQRVIDLKRFEEQARKVLQEANTKLESRVVERTYELTESNSLLRKEIEDRKRTEVALQNTRAELIHAAKMAALGQMSAGINHELNQPLAAIRSYSDNGRMFLQKGRLDDTMWNLEQISELTERMAQIGIQLKLFSRKTSGAMAIVPLHGVIDGALEILKPVIRKSDVAINVEIQPENLGVRANYVLLQQVIVNLISNALHAIEGCPVREITISTSRHEGRAFIAIKDSGTGIRQEHLPLIFEPFYTTKQSGQGLGLGLTITERIIKEMNGEIHVLESDAGAKFEFILEEA